MILLDKILLMLGLLACSLGQGRQGNRYVEVLQATSQELIAGVPGGGRGITYRLQIKIKTDRPVQFDSIWVAGKKLKLRTDQAGQNRDLKSATQEVVTLLASDYQGGPGKSGRRAEQQVPATPVHAAQAPVAYEGAALLKYVVDGSTKYVTVPTITVLPTIYGQ
jgi:hypothetical protein